MSASSIDGADKKTNTKGSLGWMASLSLGLFGNHGNEALGWLLASESELVVSAFVLHHLGDNTGISGHTRDHNTHVSINFEHLLLMDSEIVRSSFEANENLK